MNYHDYSMYRDFIDKYEAQGFQNIDCSDPYIIELEKKLEHNRQFFQIQDIIKLRLLHLSKGIKKFIGVEPHEFDFSVMFTKVHPDDLERYHLARSKHIKVAQDLLVKKEAFKVISANFRLNDGNGNYNNILFQAYHFASECNGRTVYTLLTFTNISHLEKGRHAYHYYIGNDLNNFRYPDKILLDIGRDFSIREYDILKLIAAGLDSAQIAKKLFLSINTVNTHRRNLLKKTNKSSTHELVIELQENGLL